MEQNITLSLEKELIQKARIIAVKCNLSVSKLIVKELERAVAETEEYEKARRRAFSDIESGFHLGGHGSASRDELHER